MTNDRLLSLQSARWPEGCGWYSSNVSRL